jgi:hypothetical protein
MWLLLAMDHKPCRWLSLSEPGLGGAGAILDFRFWILDFGGDG